MKMQKLFIFVKKNLKINIWKIKNHKVRDHCHYTGEYGVALHRICDSKNSVSKSISITFHNGLNYDYHFIIKVEEFESNSFV